MIKGFEEYTIEISKEDFPKVNRIVFGLSHKIGKVNAVTNSYMRKALATNFSMNIGDAEMRKLIQYIRQNNLVPRLCSNSSGYYVAADDAEWLEWTESYRSRINSMIYTIKCSIQGENVLNFDPNSIHKI